MVSYLSDDFGANYTNGGHDVGIGKNVIEAVKREFENIFDNVAIWFRNVSNYFSNLERYKHIEYWATDWLYIYGQKNKL